MKEYATIRERTEALEDQILSPLAAKSREARREHPMEECPFRTKFQRDRDRILHAKCFRRLKHKTQVYITSGDHYRTRMTHSLEVAQISRTIARGLRLNEDLTEAIALGHDVGHTPFGHNGEEFLNEIHPGGFAHNVQSLRVVDVIERNAAGRTMNLTEEVRDGIVNHTGPVWPFTLEGQVVRHSDRIAYINHDIDDAMRGGIIRAEDLPAECTAFLGPDHRSRINTLVTDIVKHSDGQDKVAMSEDAAFYMNALRDFMFANVYRSPAVKQASELDKIRGLIHSLYGYFLEHSDELPSEYRSILERDGGNEAVKDYIAGMTDRYAINMYNEKFVPSGWKLPK